MSAGDLIFLLGVALIPLVLLATVVGLFLWARLWQQKMQQDLKSLRSDLRRLQASRKGLALAAGRFSIDDPDPFGSQAAQLHQRVERIEQQVSALEYRLVDLNERTSDLARDPFRSILGAPFFGSLLRKDSAQLAAEFEQVRQELLSAQAYGQSLDKIGWQVALQARQAQALFRQASQLVDQLRSHNLYGDTVEAAERRLDEIDEALNRVPVEFYEGDEASFMRRVGKSQVISTHQTLQEVRPPLEKLLDQAQAWSSQLDEATQKVAVMRRALDEAGHTLESVPPGLNVADLKVQHDQLGVVADNLQATLLRLEVESMPLVTEQAQRLGKAARDMDGQLRLARRQVAELDEGLASLTSRLKDLSMQVATLNSKSNYPIAWSHSLQELTGLNRQLHKLGPAKRGRTPQQVGEALASLASLTAQYEELARRIQQIEQAQDELTALSTSPDAVQMPEALQNARLLVSQVGVYAAENWPSADRVGELPADLQTLEEQMQRLLGAVQPQSIPEDQVTSRLEQTRRLLEEFQSLRRRLGNVETQLGQIQGRERFARELLEKAHTALSQISFVVRSNAFLSGLASQEIERLQAEVQDHLARVSERQRGSVEKKAKEGQSLVGRLTHTCNRWLDRLNQDIQVQTQALSAALSELDAIAPLDEAALDEARRLLSSAPSFGIGGLGAKSNFELQVLVAEYKRRSDYWQACAAAAKPLQELRQHVIPSYQAADQNRQQVREMLADLAAGGRQKRLWPPASISFDEERQEFEELEGQWKSIKAGSPRAISLVRQLGDLSASYQTLAERLRQNQERAAQDRRQVEEIDAELDELTRLWQERLNLSDEYPAAVQEIRDLLAEIPHERSEIRSQYQHGARNYSQVVQSLKALQRKVRYYQVALDADHAIDVNGRVYRRR